MRERWHRRAGHRLRHSIKARLVALFLVLAAALGGTFLFGMQKAINIGWRDAARPMLADYVDRLAAEVGSPPSVERARALTQRLPLVVRIHGPGLDWESHPEDPDWHRHRLRDSWARESGLFSRATASGHRVEFGLNVQPWRDRPRLWGWITLATLLLLTLLAYKVVRRLLRPLDDISAGAQRFGRGEFGQPIPVRRRDELGDLANDVNAMAASIHQMLEAKRALLLAISHELRSPITRARLNVELLPEDGQAGARRQALLRDLQEMASLVGDLLESERLGQGHAALQREPVDLGRLAGELALDFGADSDIAAGLPLLSLDAPRIRLLLRNLLDNARRHGGGTRPALLRLQPDAQRPGGVVLSVRDFGAGVDAGVLPQLAEPFFRPDAARGRDTGGVGLGLYLAKLVVRAHGGEFGLRNAQPGLEATVRLG